MEKENIFKKALIESLEKRLEELKSDEYEEDEELDCDYDEEDEEVDFLLESIFDNAVIHGDIVHIPVEVMDSIIEYLNRDGNWEIEIREDD